jgi:hypothetical protein
MIVVSLRYHLGVFLEELKKTKALNYNSCFTGRDLKWAASFYYSTRGLPLHQLYFHMFFQYSYMVNLFWFNLKLYGFRSSV